VKGCGDECEEEKEVNEMGVESSDKMEFAM